MDAILSALEGIVDFFEMIIDFIVGIFEDIAYVVALLGEFVIEIPGYFSWLPSEAVTVIVTTFALVVVYMILNRK